MLGVDPHPPSARGLAGTAPACACGLDSRDHLHRGWRRALGRRGDPGAPTRRLWPVTTDLFAEAADARHLKRRARAQDLVALLGVVSFGAAGLPLAALLVPAAALLIGLLIKGRLLAGVVAAGLIALKVGLLLGVEVLLIAAVLQLLRVYSESTQHSPMLLRVYLIEPLQLLRGLLMVSAELAYQIHDLMRIKRHGSSLL